jgi:hypothetical protein
MGNIRHGEVIVSKGEDFRLVYHETTNTVEGWNRKLYDNPFNDEAEPIATNTWTSVNFGTPQEAARAFPGVSFADYLQK